MNEKIIDEILIRLYNDDDNKIGFKILKLQLKEFLNIDIDDNLENSILKFLTANNLCNKSHFMNEGVILELTKDGREIIYTFGLYSKYIEYKKKEEIKDKEKEAIEIELAKSNIEANRLNIKNASLNKYATIVNVIVGIINIVVALVIQMLQAE